MRKAMSATCLILGLSSAAALAHHGWGSYDAAKSMTIESKVEGLEWRNPHAMLMVEHEGAMWHVTLAPLSRLQARGVSRGMLEPGATVAAEGHPSKRNPNEMRAERITVGGETFEMR
jgi:hypothetical protein